MFRNAHTIRLLVLGLTLVGTLIALRPQPGLAENHAAQMELVMFSEQACPWCDAWSREIGPIYGKTPEGRRAPLRRVDIHDPRPADIAHVQGTRFTPTFVLLADGQEVGRIVGYPGQDFFWGLLDQLFRNHRNQD